MSESASKQQSRPPCPPIGLLRLAHVIDEERLNGSVTINFRDGVMDVDEAKLTTNAQKLLTALRNRA